MSMASNIFTKFKSVFVTPEGNYQFKKVLVRLVNATVTFNLMMRRLLHVMLLKQIML